MQLFFDPMNCSRPGSPVHGISQARILEWVAAILFSRRPSQPRDWPQVSCITGRFLTIWANSSSRLAFILQKVNARLCELSLHQNHIYWPSPSSSLEQFVRASRDAVSQAAVLILPQMKFNSQLTHCVYFLVNVLNSYPFLLSDGI